MEGDEGEVVTLPRKRLLRRSAQVTGERTPILDESFLHSLTAPVDLVHHEPVITQGNAEIAVVPSCTVDRIERSGRRAEVSTKVVPSFGALDSQGGGDHVSLNDSSRRLDEERIVSTSELQHIRELGRGIQGVVSLMTHKPSGQNLAVKRSRCRTEKDRRDLRSEIKILSRCRHPHIVTFYGSLYEAPGSPNGSAYLNSIFELMDGGCLYKAVQKNGPVPENVLRYVTGVIF